MLLVIRERICARRSMVRTLGLYPSEHLIYAKSQFESVRASQVIDFKGFVNIGHECGLEAHLFWEQDGIGAAPMCPTIESITSCFMVSRICM